MKKLLLFFFVLLVSASFVHAQKTNSQLASQIRNNRIKLSSDGGTTKLMAVAENFTDAEARSAKVMAMNFAIGFFYPGQTLERMPNELLLTFWVMSKKPVFADKNSLTIYAGGEELIFGDSRYASRARENMEYLNFNVSRDVLAKVASRSNVHLKLGDSSFKFTSDQMRMLADILELSDPLNN